MAGGVMGSQGADAMVPVTPHPDAVALAGSIDKLHSAGLGGLDSLTKVALAQAGSNNPALSGIVKSVHDAASSATQVLSHVWQDQSLMVAPTTAQKVQWQLFNTSQVPIASQDMVSAQKFLLDGGYAPVGAQANGVWTPLFTEALRNYNNAKFKTHGVGSWDSKSVVEKTLVPGLPSHAAPLIVDSMRSILHSALKVVAAVAQTAVDSATGAEFGLTGSKDKASLGDEIAASIIKLDRWDAAKKNPANGQAYLDSYGGMNDFYDAAGTVLTLWSLGSGAGALAKVIPMGIKAGLKAGAPNAAKALFTDLGKEAVRPRFTVLNTIMPKVLAEDGSAAGRRFLAPKLLPAKLTKGLQNMPVLNFMYHPSRVIATALGDGWESARVWAAGAYRLPAIGMAGDASTALMTTGLKLGAIGNAQSAVGDKYGPQTQVLEHLHPIAGVLGQALDWGTIGLHPTTYSIGSKAAIGTKVEKARTGLIKFLDQDSKIADMELTTGAKFSDLVKDARAAGVRNPVDAVRLGILNNVNRFAALHHAQGIIDESVRSGQKIGGDEHAQNFMGDAGFFADKEMTQPFVGGPVKYTDNEKQALLDRFSQEVWADPTKLEAARESYFLNDGIFRRDMLQHIEHQMENPNYKFRNEFADLLMAQQIGRANAEHFQYLFTPHTMAEFDREQRRLRASAEAVGEDFTKGKLHPNHEEQVLSYNANVRPGRIGIAKINTFTSGMATDVAEKLSARLAKLDPTYSPSFIHDNPLPTARNPVEKGAPIKANFQEEFASAEELQMREEAFAALHYELNVNTKNMKYLSTPDLLRIIIQQSHRLPSDVHVPVHAPLSLYQSVDELAKTGSGFKYVFGTDIGHVLLDTPFDLDRLGMPASKAARIAAKAGLDFTKVDPGIMASSTYSVMLQHIQAALNDTKKFPAGTLPMWSNATRLTTFLHQVIVPKMNALIAAELKTSVAAGRWNEEIADIMARVTIEGKKMDKDHAILELKNALLQNTGPRYWTRKQVVEALTEKQEVINKWGKQTIEAGMEPEQAKIFYDAMQAGLNKVPAYLEGFNPINKMVSSSFGLGGKTIFGARVPQLLGSSQKALLTFRYQGSPRFAYLRVLKSGLKGTTHGIPLTLNAEDAMKLAGTTEQDMKIRAMYLPKDAEREKVLDYVQREYSEMDVYNVYNPRKIEAYFLGHLHRNALADPKNLVTSKTALKDKLPEGFTFETQTSKKGIKETTPAFGEPNKPFSSPEETKIRNIHQVTVHDKDGKEIANFNWRISDGVITSISVDSKYQRKGIATRMFEKAIQTAKENGLKTPTHSDDLTLEGAAWKKAVESTKPSISNKEQASPELTPEAIAQIKKTFDNIYSYGSRTAAEKSVNAIFFPFSFEKTVMRELGGHILDHPGERMLIAYAMSAYDSHGKEIRDWMEANLPLFKELEKFNPFYHGIGLGTFGGINRLYYDTARNLFVNMMAPKPIFGEASARATFALVPVLRDLNAILVGWDPSGRKPINPGGELSDTVRTSLWEAGNIANHLFGHTPEDPYRVQSNLPYDVQQKAGWDMRAAWISAYSNYLYGNSHGENYHFPSSLPVVGASGGSNSLKITRDNINHLVHYIYPQWDDTKGIDTVATGRSKGAEERAELLKKAPALVGLYDKFILNADKIAGYISKEKYQGAAGDAALAKAMDTMRQDAIYLSYNDRSFYDFYKRYYQTKFGPLELME